MLIPLNAKLEKIAAKEAGRYAMTHARFERKSALDGKPALVTTDGRALVIVPVEAEEHDSDGFVSVDALKEARRIASKAKRMHSARIVANGAQCVYDVPSNAQPERPVTDERIESTFVDGKRVVVTIPASVEKLPAEPDTTAPMMTLPRPTEGEFPRYSAVIPSDKRKEVRVAFNPDFLANIADALGLGKEARAVTLHLAVNGDGEIIREAPIRVTGGTHGALGVLMPITIDE